MSPVLEDAKSETPPAETMRCMEVWGGNDAVDRRLEFSGLDAWVYSRPAGRAGAGGDLHYLSSCATGRVARILVADVAGHGDRVAPISEFLRRLLRRYVNYIDQTGLVAALNRGFGEFRDRELPGASFATALVMSWFGPERIMGICNAGHPVPLHRSRRAKTWGPVLLEQDSADPEPRNVPLGVLDEARYDRIEVELAPGDYLLAYTDAVIECLGDGSARRGFDELGSFLAARPEAEEPQELVAALVAELLRRGIGDDLTLVLLRPNGRKPWSAFSRRIGGPLRVLLAVLRGLAGRFSEIPWPEPSVANLGGAFFGPLNRLRKGRSRRQSAVLKGD